MRVATWNVNSIRARQPLVVEWLKEVEPDVLCLQETKVVDDDFPTEELQRLGYAIEMAGQKTYNGVAIVSRLPMQDVTIGLHDDGPDAEKRFISATIDGVRIVTAYVPNGKTVDSPDFPRKLEWLRRLRETLDKDPAGSDDLLLCGDFNVAPEPRDVHDPKRLEGQILFHPDERAALSHVLEFGLVDAFRLHESEGKNYSWWDYRGPMFRRNLGLRIDFIFLSRALASRCTKCWIDKEVRGKPKPSDHSPVIVDLDAST